jgi:hypothetical protein
MKIALAVAAVGFAAKAVSTLARAGKEQGNGSQAKDDKKRPGSR